MCYKHRCLTSRQECTECNTHAQPSWSLFWSHCDVIYSSWTMTHGSYFMARMWHTPRCLTNFVVILLQLGPIGVSLHRLTMCTQHCNKPQHTATHCNTLQHTAKHCNTLQNTATWHTPRCLTNFVVILLQLGPMGLSFHQLTVYLNQMESIVIYRILNTCSRNPLCMSPMVYTNTALYLTPPDLCSKQ